MMTTYIYDGSFEGLLSCIFDIYQSREIPISIIDEQRCQLMLIDKTKNIQTNESFAERVLQGIDARTHQKGSQLIYKMYLSELPQIEMSIYHLINIIIRSGHASMLENFADEYILKAHQIDKMIKREVHRMHAFVRFQKTRGNIFYAAIDPDFNVIPLIGEHFERRYADQQWIIFDTRRNYGLHYNLNETNFITLESPIFNHTGDIATEHMDDKEQMYQTLWENYFHSVNIQARKNPKLHLRHVPRRYWKYLIEKKNSKAMSSTQNRY